MLKRAAVLAALAAATVGLGSAQAGPGAGDYIVVLKEGNPALVSERHSARFGAAVTHVFKHAVKGYAARVPTSQLDALASDASVFFVSEDRELRAAAPPPETENPQVTQRSVDRIDAEDSSTRSGNGRGSVEINVAVIDSGIDSDHPDLNVAGGVNCVNDKGGFEDTYGHGTLVSGSIAARDNEVGFVGVAPGASLYSVRVLKKNGSTSISGLICGVDWVTSTRTDADPGNDIAVANMSIGGQGKDDEACGTVNRDALHFAMCRSVAAGVTYVVSAMNEGKDLAGVIPASYAEVLSASAMNDTDGLPGGLGGPEILCGLGYPDDTAAGFSNFASLAVDQRAHDRRSRRLRSLYLSWRSLRACVRDELRSSTGRGHGGALRRVWSLRRTDSLAGHRKGSSRMRPATTLRNVGYGFQGDPLRPISGKYYGYLIRAAPVLDATGHLVQPARLELPLLDPQVARELGISHRSSGSCLANAAHSPAVAWYIDSNGGAGPCSSSRRDERSGPPPLRRRLLHRPETRTGADGAAGCSRDGRA